jgi:hypothetical protein
MAPGIQTQIAIGLKALWTPAIVPNQSNNPVRLNPKFSQKLRLRGLGGVGN